MPIFEPGLEEIVIRNNQKGRLHFTTDISKAIETSTVIFSAVGTPPDADHRADLSAVKAVAKAIGQYANDSKVVVTKSTVPVGTGDLIKKIIKETQKEFQKEGIKFSIVSNPEFLREGTAVQDFLEPDRVIIGVEDDKTAQIMTDLYAPITTDEHPIVLTDVKSAEVIKYAANSFLATKISFINEIANFCEQVGGDVTEVAKGIGLDKRIGRRFLNPGIGYGGSCFPKDVKALIETGKQNSYEFQILDAVETVNERQKGRILKKLFTYYPDVTDLTIAIWGLSFKPNTDDIREAPSLVVIRKLLDQGAKVRVFDPISNEVTKLRFPEESNLYFAKDIYDTLQDSTALLILTEWDEFRSPDFNRMKDLMKEPYIFDGRNLYHPRVLKDYGFTYHSIGRV
jgi:UDPglucose 6-dehydrogenase